jgi:adhesin transport system membrane fusion protein
MSTAQARPSVPAGASPARRIQTDPALQGIAHALRNTRPGMASQALLLGVCGIFAALAFWSTQAHVDDVTRAEARVIPSGRVQMVQNLEGGVIRAIHVKVGDAVEAGAPLITLSSVQFDGERDSRRQAVNGLEARVARLSAEATGIEPNFAALARQAGLQPYVATEQAEYLGRRTRLAAELATVDTQMAQRVKEAEDARSTLAASERSLKLAQEERAIVATMVERGLEPRLELVRQDGRLSDLQGRVDSGRIAVPKLEAAIQEVRARRDTLVKQFRAEAGSELSRASAELRAQRELLPGLSDRAKRTQVISPVKGTVNRVLVTTVGGAARGGDPLVEIVPADEQLVLETMIRAQDIGFVKVGQSARIKLSAYDYSIFGTVDGVVTQVGADSVRTGEREPPVYIARIETRGPGIERNGKSLPVKPGMQATVDIITGNKTVFDYLAKPVVAVRENAFRER